MDKYSTEKDKQICPVCKSPLRRIIEWEGLATNLGGYSDEAGMAKWQTK